jgi:hypothetical protein
MAPTAPNRRPVLYPRRARPRQCPAHRRLWLSPRFSSHSFVVSFRPVSATAKMSGKAVGVRVKADPRPRHTIKCPACRGCQSLLPPLGTARLVTLPAAGCSDEAWPPGRLPRRPSLPFRGRWPRRRWPHRALRSCAAKTETGWGPRGAAAAGQRGWHGAAGLTSEALVDSTCITKTVVSCAWRCGAPSVTWSFSSTAMRKLPSAICARSDVAAFMVGYA